MTEIKTYPLLKLVVSDMISTLDTNKAVAGYTN